MLVFEERGKPENPEKNLSEQGREQKQTQPTYDAGPGNRTRATLVGGERSHHCAIGAPQHPLKIGKSDIIHVLYFTEKLFRLIGEKAKRYMSVNRRMH